MPRARITGALVVVVIAGLLAWAPAALAGAGQDAVVTKVVTQTGVDDGHYAEAAMDCGPSARAIAGGFNGDSQFPPSLIAANGPLDSGGTTIGTNDFDVPRYWYTAVLNASAGTQTYTFYAVCSASSDATVQTDSFTVPGSTSAQTVEGGTVGCPPGQRATGGGFGSTETPLPLVVGGFMSQPLDATGVPDNTTTGDAAAGWAAEVRSESSTDTHFKVIAICSPSSTATVSENEFTTGDYRPARSVTCPAGTRATGLGFGSVGGLYGQLFALAPSDAAGAATLSVGDVPRGTSARVDSIPFGSRTYRTYAMCEAESQPTPPAAAGPTGQRAAALKKCKKKHSRKARKKCRKKAALLPV
jgi:hypothetical protein